MPDGSDNNSRICRGLHLRPGNLGHVRKHLLAIARVGGLAVSSLSFAALGLAALRARADSRYTSQSYSIPTRMSVAPVSVALPNSCFFKTSCSCGRESRSPSSAEG